MTASPLSYGPFISRKQALEQGLKQFYTGKPCKHGHICAKQAAGWICVECNMMKARKDREAKGEEFNARIRERRATDPGFAEKQREKDARSRAKRLSTEEGRAADREYQRKWKREYRKTEVSRERLKVNRATAKKKNPYVRVVHNLRSRLRELVENKSCSFSKLIGCTGQELQKHLEAQFLPGMSWDNYGLHGWHVDHIRPIASFEDPTDPACWHFSNLQPLWAEDNLAKSDTWEPAAA